MGYVFDVKHCIYQAFFLKFLNQFQSFFFCQFAASPAVDVVCGNVVYLYAGLKRLIVFLCCKATWTVRLLGQFTYMGIQDSVQLHQIFPFK